MKLSKADIGFILQIQHLEDDEIIELVLDYSKKYENNYTRATKISAIKCYLRDTKMLSDPSNLKLVIDEQLTQMLKDKVSQDGLPDQVPIGQHIIDKIKTFKNSNKRAELFIYLLMVTGRRPLEFLSGVFRKCHDGHLWIDKLSKKGGSHLHPADGYKLQLHKDHDGTDHFMELYDKLQKLMHVKSTGQQVKHKSLIDSAGRIARQLGLKLSNMRPLYVLLHQLESGDDKTNPGSFIMRLLHHENHSSVSNYNSRFYIEPETHISETLTLK